MIYVEAANQLVSAIMPYVITIVTAIFGYLAVRIKSKFDEKINTETKKSVIEETVKYVQQVYETLDGKEKLQKALETSIEWLNEKGIKITEAEATILIEASIKGFKEGWTSTDKSCLPPAEAVEPTETEVVVEEEAKTEG